MRYGDWDILLFPRDCKVPVKEFKVACHVVHDAEFTHGHGSFGIPTLCCFVPSLPTGSQFQVSIHSWSVPEISQFTRSYTKYPEHVKFEARLLIDGRLVASTALERKTIWPYVIAHSFDFSKNGDLEGLKFPAFRQELLQQSYWSPADDLGRIKVVISEVFPRDSLSMPIERVKNIVAFSFQHAPLDILEGSSIAWPNPSMWRRAPFTTSMPVPAYPSDDSDSHAHSPRRQTHRMGEASGYPGSAIPRSMANAFASNATRYVQASNNPSTSGLGALDPFTLEFLNGAGMEMGDMPRHGGQGSVSRARDTRKSKTDTSMPDYTPTPSGDEGPSAIMQDQAHALFNFRAEEDGIMSYLKAPTNTPTAGGFGGYNTDGVQFRLASQNSGIPPDLASSLTNSLLNQPLPVQVQGQGAHNPATEIRSRKENRSHQLADRPASATFATSKPSTEHCEMRKVSQEVHLPSISSLPLSAVGSQVNSPPALANHEPSPVPSPGEFGANITNLSPADDTAAALGASMDKGTKRVRNFTPASSRAIDEEDEPRRASPRVRLSPFAEVVLDDGAK